MEWGSLTYGMHGCRNVHVDPDPRPVEAKVGGNEEASTRAGAVVPILWHRAGTGWKWLFGGERAAFGRFQGGAGGAARTLGLACELRTSPASLDTQQGRRPTEELAWRDTH